MCRLCWRFCECVPAFSHPPPVSPSSTMQSSSSPQRTSELDPNTQTLTRQTGPLAFADSLNRRRKTNSCPNACGHVFFSSSACLRACLSLLCKVNPGVSLSCDVTLQPRSWEREITTCLQVPECVCARRCAFVRGFANPLSKCALCLADCGQTGFAFDPRNGFSL